MANRVKGLPPNWQDFLLCVLLHMALPFLPIILEHMIAGQVADKSLFLFTAMYPLAIGISSRNKLLFGIAVVTGIFFAVAFGVLTGGGRSLLLASVAVKYCLGTIILIHLFERYNRHVVDRTPFWDFAPIMETK
jgi:hypothetical protein